MAFLPKSSRFDIMSESKVNIIFQEKPTAGSGWSDLPRTTLSSELRSDLKFLELRNVLDPHRHYRSDNLRALAPKFSQIGQIIEGPTEYFSSRLPNKERKRTLFEDVLAKEKSTGRFKKKYNEIQASKTSGKKAYYKDLKWKRSGAMRKSWRCLYQWPRISRRNLLSWWVNWFPGLSSTLRMQSPSNQSLCKFLCSVCMICA